MIKEITIQNFQSHQISTLRMAPGLNVIIGASDGGKTTIIRALRWVKDNRPGGDEFRSHWGGETSVQVETETDIIIRSKTNSKNSYNLNGSEFLAFGQDVPDEIMGSLNMTDVNLQSQMDAPYLLSESAGFVASHFNKISKLDKIDKGISNTQKEISKLNKLIEFRKVDLETAREKLKAFPDLGMAEEKIQALKNKELSFAKKETELVQLSILLKRIKGVEKEVGHFKKIILPEAEILSILKKYEIKNKRRLEISTLQNLFSKIEKIDKLISQKNKILPWETDILKLIENYKILESKKTNFSRLKKVSGALRENDKSTLLKTEKLNTLETYFKNNFPEFCPLCKTRIKSKAV